MGVRSGRPRWSTRAVRLHDAAGFPGVRRQSEESLTFLSPTWSVEWRGDYYPALYGPGGGRRCGDGASRRRRTADIIRGFKAHAELGGFARQGIAVMLCRGADRPRPISRSTSTSASSGGSRSQVADDGRIRTDPRAGHTDPPARATSWRTPSPGIRAASSTASGQVHPVVKEAMARGLRSTSATARTQLRMARLVLDAGIVPETLGADIHGYNTEVPKPAGTPRAHPDTELISSQSTRFSLVRAMTGLIACGLSLEQVVPMVTRNAAPCWVARTRWARSPRDRRRRHRAAGPAGPLFPPGQRGTEVIAERLLIPELCLRAGRPTDADAPILPQAVAAGAGRSRTEGPCSRARPRSAAPRRHASGGEHAPARPRRSAWPGATSSPSSSAALADQRFHDVAVRAQHHGPRPEPVTSPRASGPEHPRRSPGRARPGVRGARTAVRGSACSERTGSRPAGTGRTRQRRDHRVRLAAAPLVERPEAVVARPFVAVARPPVAHQEDERSERRLDRVEDRPVAGLGQLARRARQRDPADLSTSEFGWNVPSRTVISSSEPTSRGPAAHVPRLPDLGTEETLEPGLLDDLPGALLVRLAPLELPFGRSIAVAGAVDERTSPRRSDAARRTAPPAAGISGARRPSTRPVA